MSNEQEKQQRLQEELQNSRELEIRENSLGREIKSKDYQEPDEKEEYRRR